MQTKDVSNVLHIFRGMISEKNIISREILKIYKNKVELSSAKLSMQVGRKLMKFNKIQRILMNLI